LRPVISFLLSGPINPCGGYGIILPQFELFIDLTPLIPLSFQGEGEGVFREASPLFNSPPVFPPPKGRDFRERGFAPLLTTPPHPLLREGGQGDRLLNNLFINNPYAMDIP
jgi:hypothetical protein